MTNQFDWQWPILEPPEEYQYPDLFQSLPSDSASQSLDQFAAYPNYEFFAYPPPCTDDSTTSFVSGPEVFEPGLSYGGDPTPASSYRAPTCPSSEPPSSSFEGLGILDRHVADQQQPPPPLAMPSAGSCDHLRAPQLDLQCIGENPEIDVDAPVSWLPNHLQDDDLPVPPAQAGPEYAWPLPGLSGWDGEMSLAGRQQPLLSPPRDIFSQTRRTRSLAVPPTVSRPRSDPGVPSSASTSQPMARGHSMARGRSSNLSEEKRAKVARVRTTKACTHCRIRKVECDCEVPCRRHINIPELCDREKLVDVLLRGGVHGPWLLEYDEDIMVNGPSYQPCGGGGPAAHATVTSASFLNGGGLVLQPHAVNRASPWAHRGYGYGYGQSDQGYYTPPSASPFGTVPMSTSGNWPGTGTGAGATSWGPVRACGQHPSPLLLQQASLSSSSSHHHHAPSHLLPSRPTVSVLRNWVEAQVAREMAAPGPVTFEAAVQTLVFALRDGPHMWLSALAPSSSSASSSSFPTGFSPTHPPPPRRANNNNKKNNKRTTTGAGAGGGSAGAPPSARYLLRNVCEMTCWVRLWRIPGGLHLFHHREERRSEGGGRRRGDEEEARAALARAERLVLEELDGLLGSGIRGIEVPVLACLWQMILLYRQAIVTYSDDLSGAGAGVGSRGMRFGGGMEHVTRAALITAEHLSRLLVIRYAAYFCGASSIVFPKASEPSTSDLLAGHHGIQMAWNNVMALRMGFCMFSFFKFLFSFGVFFFHTLLEQPVHGSVSTSLENMENRNRGREERSLTPTPLRGAYTDQEIVASSRHSDVLLRTLVVDPDMDMERRRTDKQLREQ